MKINFFQATHVGGRKNNQDFYAHVINKKWSCFVIADGLGGHTHGEVASRAFCEALIANAPLLVQPLLDDPIAAMESLVLNTAYAARQNIIKTHGLIDTQTTFAICWLDEKQMITAHVGDSRVYRLTPKEILWRTPDHTMVQELFSQGKISENEFSNHPLQNRLLKTYNLHETPEADIFIHPPLSPEEVILLCTDGFWTHLEKRDFLSLASADNLEKTSLALIEHILKMTPVGADNITLQVLRLIQQ